MHPVVLSNGIAWCLDLNRNASGGWSCCLLRLANGDGLEDVESGACKVHKVVLQVFDNSEDLVSRVGEAAAIVWV